MVTCSTVQYAFNKYNIHISRSDADRICRMLFFTIGDRKEEVDSIQEALWKSVLACFSHFLTLNVLHIHYYACY